MAGGSDGQQRFSAKKDAYTDRSGDVVFPAHAGMIPQVWPSVVLKSSVPRTRGDDPSGASAAALKSIVFPAHAGVIPPRRTPPSRSTSVPRTHGDDPKVLAPGADVALCSPHTRG